MIRERYYKQSEVAKILGVDPATIKRWRREGKIKAIATPGGRFRYPESEVNKIIGEKKETLEIKIPPPLKKRLEKAIKNKFGTLTLDEGLVKILEDWVMQKKKERGEK